MKSKTSFFNHTLFWNLLKRFWPIFFAYLVIWLIVLPISLANILSYNSNVELFRNDIQAFVVVAARQILYGALYGGVIMSAIFAVMIAMAGFNYLYNPRSVSMMCALPIKREGVFVSVFSSGLAGMFAINLATFLISLAVTAAYGILGASLGYLLEWLALVCLTNLFFFGFAALCASFTGHILVLPVVYAVLNFTVYVVEFLTRQVASMFIYGFSANGELSFIGLSPVAYLFSETRVNGLTVVDAVGTYTTTGYSYNGWLALGIYAAVGLVFAVLAMIIIKHRRMETAGDVVALRPLKPIFKYCLSVGCALVLGILIYTTVFSGRYDLYGLNSMLYMLLFMLFGAFVGYFAAEMLLQKTLHVFSRRNWLHLGITWLIIALLIICGEFDVYGIERKLPETSEIQDVEVMCAGEFVRFEDPANIAAVIALQGDIISHKDANELNTGDFEANVSNVQLTYTYKNEKTLTRSYDVYRDASNDIYTLNDILNMPEAIKYRKLLNAPVSSRTLSDAYINYFDKATGSYLTYELTAEQAYALYSTCIIPDMDDSHLGKVWLITNDDYYNAVYDATINFSVQERLEDNNYYNNDYFYTTLTLSAERTNTWIAENLGISFSTMGESQAILQSQTGSAEEAKAIAEKAGNH